MKNILITYFSESGSTQEIAQIIAKSFGSENTNVKPVTEIQKLNCDAVIIGTPNWYGKPAPQVAKFIKKYESELAELPVALFFSCMDCYQSDPEQHPDWQIYCDSHFQTQMVETGKSSSWEKGHAVSTYITNLQKISNKLNIKSIAFFKGRLNFKKISFFNALVMRFICLINKKIKQGDYLQKQDVAKWGNILSELIQPNEKTKTPPK